MKLKVAGAFLLFFFCCATGPATADYVQLPGVVHVHSTVSSGLYSMEELVTLAKEMGLEALVMTDHDLVAMEYGVFPLRNLIKKRVEKNSVAKLGPEKYLSMISQLNQRQKDVVVIPGVQSSPFYYWTGSPLSKNLTAHNFRKELLLIGMMTADDYRDLPLMHRGFSTRYFNELLPQSIFLLLSFLMGIYLIFQRGYLKVAGIIIGLFGMVLLINYHPFQSSRFDAYHGDQGIAPYQDLIDYVNEHGGLTFWAHPESNYSKNGTKLGPIKLMTQPYTESLSESQNFTGFSAVYGDTITVTDPGNKWDQLLNEYCNGERKRPPWGIAGANFHGEADGVKLDTFQTVFWVREKSTPSIVDALAKGRMYAKRIEKGKGLMLDRFEVADGEKGETAQMGESGDITSHPVITGKISSPDDIQHGVKMRLIKGGQVKQVFEGKPPLEFLYEDRDPWVGKTYYRLEVQGGSAGKLLSNPIFIERKTPLNSETEIQAKPGKDYPEKNMAASKQVAPQKKIDRFPIDNGGFDQDKTVTSGSGSGQKALEKKVEIEPEPGAGELRLDPTHRPPATGVGPVGDDTEKLALKALDKKPTAQAIELPYSLQLASFPAFDVVQKAHRHYQDLDLPVYFVKVDLGDKGIWWRLYAGYFGSKQEALKARDSFKLTESIIQKTPYANRIGVYFSEKELQAMTHRLETMDYSPYVISGPDNGVALYIGAFITLKGAADQQRELKALGVTTEIVKR